MCHREWVALLRQYQDVTPRTNSIYLFIYWVLTKCQAQFVVALHSPAIIILSLQILETGREGERTHTAWRTGSGPSEPPHSTTSMQEPVRQCHSSHSGSMHREHSTGWVRTEVSHLHSPGTYSKTSGLSQVGNEPGLSGSPKLCPAPQHPKQLVNNRIENKLTLESVRKEI